MPVRWIATGWNIHLLGQADQAAAAHFFDTPSSFGTGHRPERNPVLDGYAATPALRYASYAQFAADISGGAITCPYPAVLYDPENWDQTPPDERRDPAAYMAMFARLAHAHGFYVIAAPARDLGNVADAVCAKQPGETLDQWYVRHGIAGTAAACCDAVVIQSQVRTTDVAAYQWLVSSAREQALAANGSVTVLAEVSTNYGAPGQMAAAARSVQVDGFYVAMTSAAISNAGAFFQEMLAAGY
jgi:hypothetical protein